MHPGTNCLAYFGGGSKLKIKKFNDFDNRKNERQSSLERLDHEEVIWLWLNMGVPNPYDDGH
jgi:hypothetical protein